MKGEMTALHEFGYKFMQLHAACIADAQQLIQTPLYRPCLAEVKGLSLYVFWVYVHWQQTGHLINGPVKLSWSLGEKRGDEVVAGRQNITFSKVVLVGRIQTFAQKVV